MRPQTSSFLRVSLLSVAIFATTSHRLPPVPVLSTSAAATQAAARTATESGDQLASSRFMTEVRLRKLHLARPDLIPYPIETEVYC
jgi:hypothetical protein